MKKRAFKKNINRFITPLIKDLPTTITRHVEIEKEGMIKVYNTNHTIVNGEVIPEGGMYKINQNTFLNIKRTAEKVEEILSQHNKAFIRCGPELLRGQVYMRLITDD